MNQSWTARPENHHDHGYHRGESLNGYRGHHDHDGFPGHHGHGYGGDAHPNPLASVDVAIGGLNATADLLQHNGDSAHEAALISADVNLGRHVDATVDLLNVNLADVHAGVDLGHERPGDSGAGPNNPACDDMQGNDGTSSGPAPQTGGGNDGTNGEPAPQTVRFAEDSLMVEKSEGHDGVTVFTFTVERDGRTGDLDFTVELTSELTSTAANSADFVGNPALPFTINCTIPDGQPSATVTVNVNGDTAAESDEDFTLTLTSVSNAEAPAAIDDDQDQATGRILTDDPAANDVSGVAIPPQAASLDDASSPAPTTGSMDCGDGNTSATNNNDTSRDPASNGGDGNGSGGNTGGNGGEGGTPGNPGTGDANPTAVVSVDVTSGDEGLNATADVLQHDGDAAHQVALISADVNVGPDVDVTASVLHDALADVHIGLDFGHDICLT
jgi:hypothetical protein